MAVAASPTTDAVAPPKSAAALLAAAARKLASTSDTARLDAELLLAAATGRSRGTLLAFPERTAPPQAASRFEALVERRARGEPLAYLVGRREFFSLELDVDAAVLVPRPETEVLVEAALVRCAKLPRPAVLDAGTGSGAIALAVKRECPAAEVTGVDLSASALRVARRNAARLALAVRWLESTWLAAVAGERFDVIVSNPPYVRSAEIAGALEYEPRVALDGGADGLDAYRALLAATPAHLNRGGALLLEHGAEQRSALTALAKRSGWRIVRALDDLAGRPRALELERGRS
jgi:release factor glutamine methyltransferase